VVNHFKFTIGSSIASNSLLAAQSTIVGIMQSFLMNALFFWFYASLIQ
jgi:hypothetical protein